MQGFPLAIFNEAAEVHVFLRLVDTGHVNKNVFSARPSPAVEFENLIS
jgi:hypothetical protein